MHERVFPVCVGSDGPSCTSTLFGAASGLAAGVHFSARPVNSMYTTSIHQHISLQQNDQQDEEPELYPSNIMFDRRVVRGNTYAARVLPAEPALTSSSAGGNASRCVELEWNCRFACAYMWDCGLSCVALPKTKLHITLPEQCNTTRVASHTAVVARRLQEPHRNSKQHTHQLG